MYLNWFSVLLTLRQSFIYLLFFYLFRTIVIELMCLHQAFIEYCFTDIRRVSLGVSGWEGNILKYIQEDYFFHATTQKCFI